MKSGCPPPPLRKYFIKKRDFWNDGFPKYASVVNVAEWPIITLVFVDGCSQFSSVLYARRQKGGSMKIVMRMRMRMNLGRSVHSHPSHLPHLRQPNLPGLHQQYEEKE